MPRRVFIGLTDVAGYFGSLADGFRAIGVPCMLIDETPGVFRYRRLTIHGQLSRAQAHASARVDDRLVGRFWRVALLALRALRLPLRLWVLSVALIRCDVFIYTAGDGIFRGRELPLLRRLGKRIVWVFTGSDHRPAYLSGRYIRQAHVEGWSVLDGETRRLAKRVAMAERYSDVIVAHTASAQFHVQPFVQFLAIGVPFALPAVTAPTADRASSFPSGRVRIAHSPSDPVAKGSDTIRRIVRSMIDDGLPIDYEEITGRAHHEVLVALSQADILIDEVYGDTPMGVLATEAAAFGVPSVCGGYYAEHLNREIPAEFVPPSRFVGPDDLEEAVRQLVTDEAHRKRLGAAARAFVVDRWQPDMVARRYLKLIDGSIPTNWHFDPAWLTYAGGWGIGDSERRSAVAHLVAAKGETALALPEDSPILRALLAEVMAP